MNGGKEPAIFTRLLDFQFSEIDHVMQFSMNALTRSRSGSQKKVCVRLLPSSMNKEAFIEMLGTEGFICGDDYNLIYYVYGNRISAPFSRGYLMINNLVTLKRFVKAIDRKKLPNHSKQISVIRSPYQCADSMELSRTSNVIEMDKDYLEFLKREAEALVNPNAEDSGEEKVFKPLNLGDDAFESNKDLISGFLSTIKLEKKNSKVKKTKSSTSIKKTASADTNARIKRLMMVKEFKNIYLDILQQLREKTELPKSKKVRKTVLKNLRETAKVKAFKKYRILNNEIDDNDNGDDNDNDNDNDVQISQSGSKQSQSVEAEGAEVERSGSKDSQREGEEKESIRISQTKDSQGESEVKVERSGNGDSKERGNGDSKERGNGEQQKKVRAQEQEKEKEKEKEKEERKEERQRKRQNKERGKEKEKEKGKGRDRKRPMNVGKAVEKPVSSPVMIIIPNQSIPKPNKKEGEGQFPLQQPPLVPGAEKSDSVKKEEKKILIGPSKESEPKPHAAGPKKQAIPRLNLKPATSIKPSSSRNRN